MKSWRNAQPGSQLARIKERVDGGEWKPGTFLPVITITPNEVIMAIAEFEEIFDDSLTNRFAHISLHDYNLESDTLARDVQACLKWLGGERDADFVCTTEEVSDLADFLCTLIRLEDSERVVHGEHGYEFTDNTKPPFA